MIVLEREWLASGEPEKMLEFLEGKASRRKLVLFRCASVHRLWPLLSEDQRGFLLEIEQKAETMNGPANGQEVAFWIFWGKHYDPLPRSFTGEGERWMQAKLLRDIFGPLPFRSIALDPAWLTWHDGTIVQLAQTIYEERAFDRLPILADALEEAGCTNAELLGHLRGAGPHSRGCWAVDAILGKA